MKVQSILVPVDFSSSANQAVKIAKNLAKQFSAELRLFHVADLDSLKYYHEQPFWQSSEDPKKTVFKTLQEIAMGEFEALKQNCFLPKETLAEVELFTGNPANRIQEYVRSNGMDLVVMSTHGRSGVSRVFMGSVAERTVQIVPCSVLVVPSSERGGVKKGGRSMEKISKILVPTDFSELSSMAAQYALSWAQKFNSEVHIFHVVPHDLPNMYGIDVGTETIRKEVANKSLKDFVKSFSIPESLKVKQETAIGAPAECICDMAKEKGMDLIILATHGRKGLSHFMLGSVAERVVRMSPCPVLVYRSKT